MTDHLHPSTLDDLKLPPEDRIVASQIERWIPYTLAQRSVSFLTRFMLHAPRKERPQGLLIAAPTGNGKSMIQKQFAKQHPAHDNVEGTMAVVPVLRVEFPEKPSVDQFYSEVLRKLYAPAASKPDDRRAEALTQFRKVQTKVVLIDEVHNLLNAGKGERGAILGMMRGLGGMDTMINLCMAGTADAHRMLQYDSELLNRIDIHRLPIWRDNDEFRQLLATFESLMPLHKPSNLWSDDRLAQAILAMSEGLIGEMFKIISRSAIHAIETGTEAISLRTLSQIDYETPSKRKVVIRDSIED